jgi:hypothetical protein
VYNESQSPVLLFSKGKMSVHIQNDIVFLKYSSR